MFDLEKQIQSWRQTLAPALKERTEAVEELESHLRDHFDELTRAGESSEQAWTMAIARLGDAGTIAREFAKVPNGPWMPARLTLAMLIVAALLLTVWLSFRLSHGLGLLLACHIFAISVGYLATFAVGICAMCATVWRAFGKLRAPNSIDFRRIGLGISIAAAVLNSLGFVLGMIWSRNHLGHWWQWDPREIGGACVVTWNCVLVSLLRSRTRGGDASGLLAGLIGNAVVALSWFGPVLLDPTRLIHVPAWYRPLLGGFLMLQLLLIYAALLPAGRLASAGSRE